MGLLKKIKIGGTGEVFDMYLGLPGAGKSLVINETVVLPALLSGEQVFSTYWVNWNKSNFSVFKEVDEADTFRNCLCVFDELGDVMNPREWEKETSSSRRFFMLHRHRYVDIVGNTQHISLIAKSARIQVDRFFMCEKSGLTRFFGFFGGLFPYLVINLHHMTLSDIQLLDMANYRDSDYVDEKPFKSLSVETVYFNIKRLYHPELDQFKQEYVHYYCPLCCHRQGIPIPKDETGAFAFRHKSGLWLQRPDTEGKVGFCEKHTGQFLEIRPTAMYDSHYEPDVADVKISFVPMTEISVKKRIPYRGSLSSLDSDLLRRLNNSSF